MTITNKDRLFLRNIDLEILASIRNKSIETYGVEDIKGGKNEQ